MSAPAPPAYVAGPGGDVACVVGREAAAYGDYTGATTGAVCDALRHHGASVGPVVGNPQGYRAAYVVNFHPSGSSWALIVTYEEPVGRPLKTRSTTFDNLSEVPAVAQPLADAMLDDSSGATEVERTVDFGGTVDGWIGGGSGWVVDDKSEGGIALGATGLLQYKLLDAGIGLTATTALFGGSATILSALAGIRYDPVPWFRFDLLGEGGAETVNNVGSGLFDTTISGGHATLPYVGGRASLSFLIGHSHRFLLGWWFNSGSTIGTRDVDVTVESCFLGCSVNTETHTVGGPSFSTGLRLGAFIH